MENNRLENTAARLYALDFAIRKKAEGYSETSEAQLALKAIHGPAIDSNLHIVESQGQFDPVTMKNAQKAHLTVLTTIYNKTSDKGDVRLDLHKVPDDIKGKVPGWIEPLEANLGGEMLDVWSELRYDSFRLNEENSQTDYERGVVNALEDLSAIIDYEFRRIDPNVQYADTITALMICVGALDESQRLFDEGDIDGARQLIKRQYARMLQFKLNDGINRGELRIDNGKVVKVENRQNQAKASISEENLDPVQALEETIVQLRSDHDNAQRIAANTDSGWDSVGRLQERINAAEQKLKDLQKEKDLDELASLLKPIPTPTAPAEPEPEVYHESKTQLIGIPDPLDEKAQLGVTENWLSGLDDRDTTANRATTGGNWWEDLPEISEQKFEEGKDEIPTWLRPNTQLVPSEKVVLETTLGDVSQTPSETRIEKNENSWADPENIFGKKDEWENQSSRFNSPDWNGMNPNLKSAYGLLEEYKEDENSNNLYEAATKACDAMLMDMLAVEFKDDDYDKLVKARILVSSSKYEGEVFTEEQRIAGAKTAFELLKRYWDNPAETSSSVPIHVEFEELKNEVRKILDNGDITLLWDGIDYSQFKEVMYNEKVSIVVDIERMLPSRMFSNWRNGSELASHLDTIIKQLGYKDISSPEYISYEDAKNALFIKTGRNDIRSMDDDELRSLDCQDEVIKLITLQREYLRAKYPVKESK